MSTIGTRITSCSEIHRCMNSVSSERWSVLSLLKSLDPLLPALIALLFV